VRSATPLISRPGEVERSPQRIACDQLADLLGDRLDLAGNEAEQLGKRGEGRRVGDEAALVRLGGAQLGELAQPGDQRGKPPLGRAGRPLRCHAFDLGKPGNDAAVDAIGLFEKPHRLGKAAHSPWVDDRRRDAGAPQHGNGEPFVPAGRFERDQPDLVLFAEGGQLGDAAGIIAKPPDRAVAAEPGIEGGRRDIHSTDKVRHGNLPCPCDRQSSDCAVVRDTAAGGPKAHQRLLPEGQRAPRAAHGIGWPPDPAQRRTHHTPAPIAR
jgi:hypothetical protein